MDDIGLNILSKYLFRTKEEFDEFLYECCTKEERHELLVRLGQFVVEGE